MPLSFLLTLASQAAAVKDVDGTTAVPLWVLLSTIAVLGTANAAQWKSDQKRGARIAGEFEKKDTALLAVVTQITTAVERFVAAVDKLADRTQGVSTEVRELAGRLERLEDDIRRRE